MGRASRKNRIKKIWREVEPSLRSQLKIIAAQEAPSVKERKIFNDQLSALNYLSFKDQVELSLLVEKLKEEIFTQAPPGDNEPPKYQVDEFYICDHYKNELESMNETERLRSICEYIRGM